MELRIVFFKSIIFLKQSEVAGLLVSVAAAAARLVAVAVVRQKRGGVSAEEGFAQVCSQQSQAETTLRRRGEQAGQRGQVEFGRVREGRHRNRV